MRAALLGLFLTAGCYAPANVRAEPYQRAFYRGHPDRAADMLQHRLDTQGSSPDRDVLRLELASALIAAGRDADAAALLVAADDELETLDYTRAPLDTLAEWVFAREPKPYRATRFERLLVNAQALLGFLVAGNVQDAAVEARRARVLLLQSGLADDERYASVLIWALAGVALQHAGAHGEAADAFRAARDLCHDDPARLSAVEAMQSLPAVGQGSLLVVVQNGRIPVRAQAIVRIWVQHALRRVQFPALVARPGGYARIEVEVDDVLAGVPVPLLDVGSQALRRYDDELPRLLAAALVAAVPRAFASDAVRNAIAQDHDHDHDTTRDLLADLAGFLAGELLAEALPADTRCWTLLPAEFRVLRVPLLPGAHRVAVTLQDSVLGAPPRRVEWQVDLREGQLAVIDCVTAVEEGWAEVPAPGEQDLTRTLAGQQALELLHASD